MTVLPRTLEGGLRWAGYLVAAGLIVQVASSWWVHPLAFILFLVVACPLVVAGILLFLWTLASSG